MKNAAINLGRTKIGHALIPRIGRMAASSSSAESMNYWRGSQVTVSSLGGSRLAEQPKKLKSIEALSALRASASAIPGSSGWLSFYSSALGGIVTDAALMVGIFFESLWSPLFINISFDFILFVSLPLFALYKYVVFLFVEYYFFIF